MNYNVPNVVWKDIRACIADYSADELLSYYRSAKCYANDHEAQAREGVPAEMCRAMYQRVDSIISVLRCSTDYKVVTMAKILELEYCFEPADATSRIESVKVSKTTYYKYCREAKKLFCQMAKAMNQCT